MNEPDSLKGPERQLGKSVREKEKELLNEEYIKDVDKNMDSVRTEARRYAFPVVIMVTGLTFLLWSIAKIPLHGFIPQIDLLGPFLFFSGFAWGNISKRRRKQELDSFAQKEGEIIYGKE